MAVRWWERERTQLTTLSCVLLCWPNRQKNHGDTVAKHGHRGAKRPGINHVYQHCKLQRVASCCVAAAAQCGDGDVAARDTAGDAE